MRVKRLPIVSKVIVRKVGTHSGDGLGGKEIVMQAMPAGNFSRAYGKQVLTCSSHGKGKNREWYAHERGAGDLIPIGKVKRIPEACRRAVAEYKEAYAPLFAKGRGRP